LIGRIQAGDQNAYTVLVHRFQDMAVGYAYAALGNLQLAEDAAQEAFITAYYTLPRLRDSAAFPGWFRRILHTQVNRLQRVRSRATVSLDQAVNIGSEQLNPAVVIEQREAEKAIVGMIHILPEGLQQAALLFYINQYSYEEIAAFLELPISTVKMRIYYARKRLKAKRISMLRQQLYQQRPSRNETFQQDLRAMLELVKARPLQRADDYPTSIDLQELFGVPETQSNTRLWETPTGELLGFAIVNPHYQTVDLEVKAVQNREPILSEMIEWATVQMHQAGLKLLRTHCRADNQAALTLFATHGFTPEPHGTIHLQRALNLPIPPPQLPDGFIIRPVVGEQEVEQLVELQRAAFGTMNMTVAYRLAMMRVPDYEPLLDLVVVAPDGSLAAFCLNIIPATENQLTGRKEGWLDPIGTRPQFQRRGFARALLRHGLHLLQQRGIEQALTNAAEDNVAMQRTAESAGFVRMAKTIWLVKQIEV